MPIFTRRTSSGALFRLGLFFLAAAAVTSYVLQRKTALPESITDPAIGLAYGVAIATALLGVYRQSRSTKGSGTR